MSGSSRQFDVIISDIDGCLSPESSDAMDVTSLAQLAEHNRRAQQDGDRPVITVCSGRPQPFAEAMCRLIGNTTIPAVCENGAWVYDPKSNGYLMHPSINAEHLASVGEVERWVRSELGPLGVTIQPGKSASVSLYHPDPAYLRSLQDRIRETFAREGWPLRVSMTWFYINCDLAHISKGSGLDVALDALSIPKERLAGIGDTESDLAIRERVSWFGCPSNARDGVKQHADFVATRPEAEGVIEIVTRVMSTRGVGAQNGA